MPGEHTSWLGGPSPFPSTSWQLISACQDPDDENVREHLERLFRKYWSPVYFYVFRNWARDVERAKDLTQAFFATLLEKNYLAAVSPEKGRFRSFVCASLKNFLMNQKRADNAQKRRPAGGVFSLDRLKLDDSSFDVPAPTELDPTAQFDADWKRSLLDVVLDQLRRRATKSGKQASVDLLIVYDLERPDGQRVRYKDLAARFQLTVPQVRNGLHWARKEFMRLLREELAGQVCDAEQLSLEAAELFGAGP